METKELTFKVRPARRLMQVLVLFAIIAVPYYSRNPLEWPPSRIVLGHLPPANIFPVTGDTWSISISGFKLLHPVAFIEAAVSSKAIYIPALLAVIIPLAITLVLGRVFCSWLCPVGFLLELNQKVNALLRKVGLHYGVRFRDLRYTLLFVSLTFGFIFAFPLISVFDPPHLLGRELMYFFTHNAVTLSGITFLFGILLFETVSTSRAWCNYLCPSGGGLSLLGSGRLLNIKMEKEACVKCSRCDDACPYYLEPMGLAEGKKFDWAKCENCGLCRDECPTAAISYSLGKRRNS
jgi:ferredoxin-type protein NapH